MGSPCPEVRQRRVWLAQCLKGLRRARGLSVAAAAQAMGMPLRSYEHFESGGGRMDLDRIHRFAGVLDVDPYAILLAVEMGAPAFALRCADNKLATILVMALQDFDAAAGDAMRHLDPATLFAGFRAGFDDLARQARDRAALAAGRRDEGATGGDPSA